MQNLIAGSFSEGERKNLILKIFPGMKDIQLSYED